MLASTKIFQAVTVTLLLVSTLELSCQSLERGSPLVDREVELRDLLFQEFVSVISKTTYAGQGTFAAVSNTSNALEVGAVVPTKQGRAYTINVSGGAVEGVTGLFTNGRINSKVSLDLAVHWMLPAAHPEQISVSRDFLQRDALERSKTTLDDEYELQIFNLQQSKQLIELQNKRAGLQRSLIKTKAQLHTLQRAPTIPPTPTYVIDSLRYDSAKIEFDLVKTNTLLVRVIDKGFAGKEQLRITRAYRLAQKEIDEKITQLRARSLQLTWFSLGVKASNDAFKLARLDSLAETRLTNTDDLEKSLYLAISRYKYDADLLNTTYWSAGAKATKGNNLTDLTSITYRELYPVVGDSSATAFSDQTAYLGEFFTNLDRLTLYADYYSFFGSNGSPTLAYHLKPEALFRERYKPVYSMTVGLLRQFNSPDDKTIAVANVEVFIKFQDVFSDSDKDKRLISQQVVGVQATFPISFL